MLWPRNLTRTAGIYLLLLSLSVSGCSSIARIILEDVVSSSELAEDARICKKRCASFVGEDYVTCHKGCMFVERSRRSEMKQKERWEKEQKESNKSVMDKKPKGP